MNPLEAFSLARELLTAIRELTAEIRALRAGVPLTGHSCANRNTNSHQD